MKITKEIIITILVLLVTIFGVVYTNKAISGRQSERLKNSNTIL